MNTKMSLERAIKIAKKWSKDDRCVYHIWEQKKNDFDVSNNLLKIDQRKIVMTFSKGVEI